MLTIRSPRIPRSAASISRRQLVQIGGAGLLGLSLPKLFAAEESTRAFRRDAKAKSVIFLFLFGGPSQLETFDLKPEAPAHIRGPFRPIRSRTPGLLISEALPKLAAISDKYCVIRSMTHTFNDHSGGGHYIQTGKRWQVPVGGGFVATPQDWPSIGSVVEFLSQQSPGGLDRELPAYATVPNWLGKLQEQGQYKRPGEYAGWLGGAFNPLTTRVDKRDLNDNPYWRDCTDEELAFVIDGLAPEVPLKSLRERATLLEQFEVIQRRIDSGAADSLDRHRRRALALATSDKSRAALDIRREPARLRDAYGRHLFGQSCLLARRLVESGVRFVTVHYDCVDGYSWDSHRNNDDVKQHLMPTFDQAASALIADLDSRGLLQETLVVAVGEMGRTPKANAGWGRDHWSTCFPCLLAGGGVQGGTLYGASDDHAAYVKESPVSPEDLAKTLYWSLGIDPELQLMHKEGRPVPIVESGTALTRLFS
jgi:hypothetical protein